ncbi:MAG TPA: ATP-dependent helicase [Chloroflexota bacterium]|nr:ATP-dependent helicase [Chloroflexota bacterium]
MLDLSRLTEAQRRAVTATDGPLLVIAGPGSGKTTVLAARIAHLVLMRNVSPAAILAVAFTRAAAGALRQRLSGMLREQARDVDVSTFHSLCFRIVRLWWEELGFAHERLTVYSEQEQRTEIERLTSQLKLDAGPDSEDVLRGIDRFRLDGESPGSEAVRKVAQEYEMLLRRRAVLDFTAMLSLPLRLFADREDALRLHQDAYRHVLADEFQDLTLTQYSLLRRLAEQHHNLVVVADPAQSLYRWRGAGGHVLEAFGRDFPEAERVSLEENFRSTQRILALANAVGLEVTRGRQLRTDNPDGLAPVVFVAADEQDEAHFIAEEIGRLLDDAFEPDAIAVLYRTNAQADPIGLALRAAGIAYRVRGRADLLSRKEVLDAVAYLRLSVNPDDALALARVVNSPPRDLGRLVGLLREAPVATAGLVEAARPFGRQAMAGAESLVGLVSELHQAGDRLRPAQLLDAALTLSGYRKWLEEQRAASPLSSVAKLRRVLEQTEDIQAWLAETQLGQDELEEPGPAVTLSSVHSAKGCEWRAVFVAGLEEGLLPNSRALAEDDQAEALLEERRLAYVAVARARERLYLTYCRRRTIGDEAVSRLPSRFLRSLPRGLLRPAA